MFKIKFTCKAFQLFDKTVINLYSRHLLLQISGAVNDLLQPVSLVSVLE